MSTDRVASTAHGATLFEPDVAALPAGVRAERDRLDGILRSAEAEDRDGHALALALDTATASPVAIRLLSLQAKLEHFATIEERAEGLAEFGAGSDPGSKESQIDRAWAQAKARLEETSAPAAPGSATGAARSTLTGPPDFGVDAAFAGRMARR